MESNHTRRTPVSLRSLPLPEGVDGFVFDHHDTRVVIVADHLPDDDRASIVAHLEQVHARGACAGVAGRCCGTVALDREEWV